MKGTYKLPDTAAVFCPYCGVKLEVFIDVSGGTLQTYVDDCEVCCQPIEFRLEWNGKQPHISAKRGNE